MSNRLERRKSATNDERRTRMGQDTELTRATGKNKSQNEVSANGHRGAAIAIAGRTAGLLNSDGTLPGPTDTLTVGLAGAALAVTVDVGNDYIRGVRLAREQQQMHAEQQ